MANEDSSSPSSSQSPSACPVDHTTRAAWLKTARKDGHPANPLHPHPTTASTTLPEAPSTSPTTTCDSSSLNPIPPSDSNIPLTLSSIREVSSIPRSLPSSTPSTPSTPPTPPANAETYATHTSPSGHWIYPSEAMFFAAMRRKSWDPSPHDMPSVVNIHNAVNERCWQEIRAWESLATHRYPSTCDGPKLYSFSGDAGRLTPKARLMMLLGYQRPFDRHDWVVDRCGKKVEYVIDFYSGRQTAEEKGAGGVSFYLDVRPKLNSLEGVWLRAARWWHNLF